MELGLRGRVAVVCASSTGLGRAAALAFAREGAHLVICSREKKKITSAAKEIAAEAGERAARIVPVVADLSKPADCKRLIKTTIKEFGRIDVLVPNAGGPPVAQFPDIDDETWDRGIQLTLMSTVRLIREALPHMRKQGWGRVVTITSLSAKQPINDLIISSTIRPGLLALTKILSNQYAKEGVLFSAVAPGYILTARQQEISESRAKQRGVSKEQYLAEASRDIPVGRYGDPDELANVIVFLASERASYVTGTTFSVDGGLVKGLF